MRVGLALPHYDFSLPGGGPVTFASVAEVAVRAERLGFDSVWVSDHFFASLARYGGTAERYGALEPLVTLAGLAPRTERVRLGTLVLSAGFRHPAIVAKAATAIDLLSGGRLDLGLGAGWFADEYEAFGYPFEEAGERIGMLEETLEVLGALFDGEPASHRGQRFTLREAYNHPRPAQERRPPLFVGGKGGPRLLGIAVRLAGGWNAVWRWTPEGYAERAAAARRACERGRPRPGDLRALGRAVHGGGRGRGGPVETLGADARAPAARCRRRGGSRGPPGRRARGNPGAGPRAARRVRGARGGGADRLPRAGVVLDARPVDARPARRGRPAGARGSSERVEPLEAALAVLREEGEPLHWTRIQDLALRRGYLDPVRDARRPQGRCSPRSPPRCATASSRRCRPGCTGCRVSGGTRSARSARASRSGARPRRTAPSPSANASPSSRWWRRRPSTRTPAEQRAVGDAGRGEEHVVAGHEVVGGEHPLEVVAGVEQLPALLVVARDTAGPGSRRRGTSGRRRRSRPRACRRSRAAGRSPSAASSPRRSRRPRRRR